MERLVLRGLLYVVLAMACVSYVFSGPAETRPQTEREAGVVALAMLAALAISARVEPEPATERRPAAGGERPAKAGASRPPA